LFVSDSGVGAGIDSYYEYVLKAYILLGDETYLDRFNKVCPSVAGEVLTPKALHNSMLFISDNLICICHLD